MTNFDEINTNPEKLIREYKFKLRAINRLIDDAAVQRTKAIRLGNKPLKVKELDNALAEYEIDKAKIEVRLAELQQLETIMTKLIPNTPVLVTITYTINNLFAGKEPQHVKTSIVEENGIITKKDGKLVLNFDIPKVFVSLGIPHNTTKDTFIEIKTFDEETGKGEGDKNHKIVGGTDTTHYVSHNITFTFEVI